MSHLIPLRFGKCMKLAPLSERLQAPHLTQKYLRVHVVAPSLLLLLVGVQSLVPFIQFFIPSLSNFELPLVTDISINLSLKE